MPDRDQKVENAPDPRMPDALARDLRALLGGNVEVPAQVDARIWAAARRHAVQQRRRRVAVWWVRAGAAVAAAVALAAWLAWPARQLTVPGSTLKDASHVDILDAFTLAKNLERRTAVDASWDINHDGNVDRQDVDLIAARAVSLEERVIQ
jgi:hypothetical protein